MNYFPGRRCDPELAAPANRRALTPDDLTQMVDDAAEYAGQAHASAEQAVEVVAGIDVSLIAVETSVAQAETYAQSAQEAQEGASLSAGEAGTQAANAGLSAASAADSVTAAQGYASDAEDAAQSIVTAKGQPNGIAPLGSDSRIPESFVPIRLGEQNLTTTIGVVAQTVAMPIASLDALVSDSTSAATANTSAIQAALDSAFYRVVYLPDGLYYVNALSIPTNKHLTGEFSRAYTTAPTSGTRLRAATAAQTAAVITMNGRSKLTNIAVLGAGSGAAHPGVRIASNGGVLRDCAIGLANSGVEADYKLAILENVHIFSNTFDGIRNILDGKVIGCTINANGRRGIYAGTGANCTQYIGNRIEWNLGRGVDLYQANLINLVSNIIDRNGGAGLAAVQTDRMTIVGNDFWRNGAQSQGVAADDCNIFLQQNVNEKIVGNGTKTGENDGGGGYTSPLVAVRSQSNSGGLVTANDFAGGTATGWQTVTADTGVKRHSNILRAGESETFIGPSYAAEASASGVAAGGTATITLTLPVTGTNSTGRVVHVAISGRDHASSSPFAASFDIFISRALSGDAIATVGPLTNIAGTAFSFTTGTHVISTSVSADGATLTLTVTNGSSNTRSFVARAN